MSSDVDLIYHSTILIVEDEEYLVELLEEILGEEFEKVLVAKNGDEAIDWIAKENIHVALIDIRLPGQKTGLDVLRNIQTLNKATAGVILTGNAERECLKQALLYGAYDFLEKPSPIETIITRVKRACGYNKQERHKVELFQLLLCEVCQIGLEDYYKLETSRQFELVQKIKNLIALKLVGRE